MNDEMEEINVELDLLIKLSFETFDKIEQIAVAHRASAVQRVKTDFRVEIEKERHKTTPLTEDSALELIELIEKQIKYYEGVQDAAGIFSYGRRAGYVEPDDVRDLHTFKKYLCDLSKMSSELRDAIRRISR